MNFAHSFWFKPLKEKRFFDFETAVKLTLVEYAYSVRCIQTNGYKITLYTDPEGAEFLSCIPYDEIVVIDEPITNDIHYAASMKFAALERMPLGDSLIDGDLFITKGKGFAAIETSNSDVTAMLTEPKDYIFSVNNPQDMINMLDSFRNANFSYPYKIPKLEDFKGWTNTCLLRFTNKKLLKDYIKQYKTNIKLVEDIDTSGYWPDFVLEQLNLSLLCKSKSYTINTLLDNFPSTESFEQASNLGLCHLGGDKVRFQDSISDNLQALDPIVFDAVCAQILKYLDK